MHLLLPVFPQKQDDHHTKHQFLSCLTSAITQLQSASLCQHSQLTVTE